MKTADDLVLCGGDEDGVTGYIWSWRIALEGMGMGVSIDNGWNVGSNKREMQIDQQRNGPVRS